MRHCILAGVFLLAVEAAWAVSLDETREQVIRELGKPNSTATRGGREILLYPKGVRLELESGRIVSAQGITLSEPASESAPAVKPEPVKTDTVAPATPITKNQSTTEKQTVEPEYTQETAKVQAGVEKSLEALSERQEQAQHPLPREKFNIINFAVELILIFLMTVGALKLACKYWGAEVFWSGILTVGAVDAVVRGAMILAGKLLLGFPTLFYADEAVAGIVMVILLKKFSINQSTAQAVQLTLTSKTFTVVVGAFLITVILRSLH
jgi:hypothetical protein